MQLPEKYPVYIERRRYLMIVMLLIVIISGFITYYSFKTYTVYHIYSAFVFAVSLVYLSWLYFNPFCIVHNNHFEINSGLFSHRKFFYRDITKVEVNENKNKMILIFNDHEICEVSIRLIRKIERDNFIELIKIHIYKDYLDREE